MYGRQYRQRKLPIFLVACVGVLVGGAIVFFTLPMFVAENNKLGVKQAQVTQQAIQPTTIQTIKSSDITKAIEKASDAVVGVVNLGQENTQNGEILTSTGSGVIYKKDNNSAYIITNHHVIEGAKTLEVSLTSGKRLPATLLGSDIVTDLAVLKVDGKDIKVIAMLGDSTKLVRGEPVVAIGNPLGLEFSGTATEGIISATRRIIPFDYNNDEHYDWQVEVLQTDAAINPGNSGGALIDSNGNVIGINSMKIAQQSVEGIGFAIPITIVKPVVNELEKNGKVKRPYMGIEVNSLNELPTSFLIETLKLPKEVQEGICITYVKDKTAANLAGLKKYDVIVDMSGIAITDVAQFREELYKHKVNEKIKVTFYRGGKKQTVDITLGEEKY